MIKMIEQRIIEAKDFEELGLSKLKALPEYAGFKLYKRGNERYMMTEIKAGVYKVNIKYEMEG